MKSINLSIAVITALFIVFSCSSDKKGELNKLKQQQSVLDEKIKALESELSSEPKETLNSKEYKFV